MNPHDINELANFIVLMAVIPFALFTGVYGLRDPWYHTYLGIIMFGLKLSQTLVLAFIISRRLWGEYLGYEWIAVVLYSSLTIFAWLYFLIFMVERRQNTPMAIPLNPNLYREKREVNELIPADMTDTAMWAIIVGFVSPVVLNLLLKATWPSYAKAIAAFAFSAVIGTVTAVLTGSYEGLGIPSAILLTAVVSITAYQGFWKQVAPTMQRGAAEKKVLENKAQVNLVTAIAQTEAEKAIESIPVAEVVVAEPVDPRRPNVG